MHSNVKPGKRLFKRFGIVLDVQKQMFMKTNIGIGNQGPSLKGGQLAFVPPTLFVAKIYNIYRYTITRIILYVTPPVEEQKISKAKLGQQAASYALMSVTRPRCWCKTIFLKCIEIY